MARETLPEIERINERFQDRPYFLEIIEAGQVRYAEKNARFMPAEQFANLSENIGTDGELLSVPLVFRDDDGRYVVLSGNHRIMAAREAGLNEFLVMVLKEKPSREKQVAIQLSHNSIVGRDDEQILKELWQEIEDARLKKYSGLSTEEMERIEKLGFTAIKEEQLDFEEISLLFLPGEKERIEKILKDLGSKKALAGRIDDFSDILEGILLVKSHQDIINTTLAFQVLAEAVRDYLDHKVDIREAVEEGSRDTTIFYIGGVKKRIKRSVASKLRKILNDGEKTGLSTDEVVMELINHVQEKRQKNQDSA